MVDIQEEPFDSLDVRFIEYGRIFGNDPIYLFGDCDHLPGELILDETNSIGQIRFESKEFFGRGINCHI